MWPFLSIYVLLVLLSLLIKKPNKFVYFLLFALLVVFAGFRGDIDKDYQMYVSLYDQITSGDSDVLIEFTYINISKIVNILFSNVLFVFIIYAIFGVGIMFFTIKKYSEFELFSILIYFSNFFLLHEMTQIRGGVSIGIFLFSISAIIERNFFKYLIFILLGSCFHISLLFVIPFYFLNTGKIKFYFFLIIPIAYVIYYTKINVISILEIIKINHVATKLQQYHEITTHGINVLNLVLFSKIIIAFIFYWKIEFLQKQNKYAILLLKFYILSSFFFVFLAQIPAFGFRISNMFCIVEVILIPYFIYLFKNKLLGRFVVISVSALNIFILLYYVKLFENYF